MPTDNHEDDDVPVFRRVVEDGVEDRKEVPVGKRATAVWCQKRPRVIQVLHAPEELLIDMRNLVDFLWTSSLRTFWS